MKKVDSISQAYALAKERYAALGVDVDKAVEAVLDIPISIHCWQGDDVAGFENPEAGLSGGIQATGNYPGKASTPEELRSDLEMAFSLIPGKHRLNLHAIYGEFGSGKKRPDRNNIGPEHFKGWLDWAKANKIGLDFNPSYFSHPKSADGFTLSSADKGIRKFWIEHGIACRKIGAYFGKALKNACVTNVWIPDGYKDTPVDRKAPRERLKDSLDAIFKEKIDPKHNLDAVEGKLFGIGSESYVVGSNDFYLGYAANNDKLVTLDAGHYHPTETISDKISAVLTSGVKEVLLHVSRGVRWDSDHVVTLTDDLRALAEEIVRGQYLKRVHIGLDYFDASINRIAAWVIGTRAMNKALLLALLEPTQILREAEAKGDFTGRLALLEECKSLPFGAVWDYCCEKAGVPAGPGWIEDVRTYERTVLFNRG